MCSQGQEPPYLRGLGNRPSGLEPILHELYMQLTSCITSGHKYLASVYSSVKENSIRDVVTIKWDCPFTVLSAVTDMQCVSSKFKLLSLVTVILVQVISFQGEVSLRKRPHIRDNAWDRRGSEFQSQHCHLGPLSPLLEIQVVSDLPHQDPLLESSGTKGDWWLRGTKVTSLETGAGKVKEVQWWCSHCAYGCACTL